MLQSFVKACRNSLSRHFDSIFEIIDRSGGLNAAIAKAKRIWSDEGWEGLMLRLPFGLIELNPIARFSTLEAFVRDQFSMAGRKVAESADYVPIATEGLDSSRLPLKTIAFYLPQFHPIPENDLWWGKGFTEWTNVTKAQPQFLGHYQPHLPGELGFYDLRRPEVMHRQIELAQLYGIAGFCFHYYWFGGKRLLELPVNNFLADPSMTIDFCFCWANENWTRRWDGSENELLLAQNHSPEDDLAFIDAMLPAFADPRYIRVDDKPLLIVYRANILPDARATAERWRRRAQAKGFAGLYLVAARTFDVFDPRTYGFDASVEFPPHQVVVDPITRRQKIINRKYLGNIFDYSQVADSFGLLNESEFVNLKTVMPSWDNEARKPGKGNTFTGASPELYAKWLTDAAKTTLRHSPSERLLFINAWNEWAEGTHLEPDRQYGYAYLQATADVLRKLAAK